TFSVTDELKAYTGAYAVTLCDSTAGDTATLTAMANPGPGFGAGEIVPGDPKYRPFATGCNIFDPPSADTTVDFNDAELLKLAVTPKNPSVNAGLEQQFIATGTFDDGEVLNLTRTSDWSLAPGPTVNDAQIFDTSFMP